MNVKSFHFKLFESCSIEFFKKLPQYEVAEKLELRVRV